MLRARFQSSLKDVPRAAWNALVPGAHPFLSHEFLEGLERCGCIRPELGWRPHHATLWNGDQLVGAAPCYLKGNSHGEFVFDYAWAEAYERMGMSYYPKLLCAVPYSPVVGPRLMVRPEHADAARATLAQALCDEVERLGLSGAHVNFLDEGDDRALSEQWLSRGDWQFHWNNRDYGDFGEFLGVLNAKRRKEIRRERERLAKDGWSFEQRLGSELGGNEMNYVYRCYARTFVEKGNYPALTAGYFAHLAETLGDRCLVVFARHEGELCAMAYFLRSEDTLFGRYWGSERYAPGLHFECCYYQGIEYCIAQGLARFEPGAQGEHKLARGFLPVRVGSRHWLRDPRMRAAIGRATEREARWLEGYGASLMEHSPYAVRET
jgi:predicted N-acyltransferase